MEIPKSPPSKKWLGIMNPLMATTAHTIPIILSSKLLGAKTVFNSSLLESMSVLKIGFLNIRI